MPRRRDRDDDLNFEIHIDDSCLPETANEVQSPSESPAPQDTDMTTPTPANDVSVDSEGSDATILNSVEAEAEDIDLAGRRNSGLSNASYESDRRPPSQPASEFEQSARHSFASVSDGRQSLGGSEPAGGRVSAGDDSSHLDQDDDVFSDHSPRSSTCSNAEADQLKQPKAHSRRLTGGSRISDMQPYDPDEEFVPTVREMPRPPFRSPSSVKAMQMSSPPPSVSGSARSNRRATRSSISRIGSPAVTTQFSPKKTPPRFKRNTPPLVLLHVTLLALRWPWGHLMDNARPSELSDACKNLREAWKQLQARVGDTICDRGILLPHPQNDFEILEERLLEALELPLRRRARILQCGHYLGPANEMASPDDEIGSDDEDFEQSPAAAEERHWCSTCQSDIRYDSLGEGKMFRTKVYASNGLMKAGAWDACWKEMERVDVELEPIIDPSIVDELERVAATQEREAIEAEIAASTHMELNGPDDAFDAPPAHEDERELYEERMREIYGQPESHEAAPEEVITETPADREAPAQPWSIASVVNVRSGPWADAFKYGPRDVVQLLVFILCVLLLQYLGIGFDKSINVETRKGENPLPVPAMPPQESPSTETLARQPSHEQTATTVPHPMEESYAACTSALQAAHASLAVPVPPSTVTVTETVSVLPAETARMVEVEPSPYEQSMPETREEQAVLEKQEGHIMLEKQEDHTMPEKQEEHTMLEKQEEHTMLEKQEGHTMLEKKEEYNMLEKQEEHTMPEAQDEPTLPETQDEQPMFEALDEHTAEAPLQSENPIDNTVHEDREEDQNDHDDLSYEETGKTEL